MPVMPVMVIARARGEDADRLGPAGSDTLGASREAIDGGEMTVWHRACPTGRR
jgi:hypothetical protein